MNATCRQVLAPRSSVLSRDLPLNPLIDIGTWFHSLHATSQALQPMQIEVSVKKPIDRGAPVASWERVSTRWLTIVGGPAITAQPSGSRRGRGSRRGGRAAPARADAARDGC